MRSVRGSAPGRRIGIRRWASMCRSIDLLILYDNSPLQYSRILHVTMTA
jgi:hypothetical protein